MVYIVALIIVILYLWLSWLAYRKRRHGKAIRRFTGLLVLSAMWITVSIIQTYLRIAFPTDNTSQVVLAKFDFSLAAAIAFMVALFALHFPKENKKLSLNKEVLLALPILMLIFLSISGFFFNQELTNNVTTFYATQHYWYYISVLIIYFLGLGLGVFIWKLNRSEGIIKLQLKYISVTYGITILILLFLSIINAIYDYPEPGDLWLTNASMFFVLGSAYAMLKFRLFGLNYLIRRGAFFLLSVGVIFFFYTYIILALQQTYGEQLFSETNSLFLTVFIIVVSYPILYKFIQRGTRSLFTTSSFIVRENIVKKMQSVASNRKYSKYFIEYEQRLKDMVKGAVVTGYVVREDGKYYEEYPKETDVPSRFSRSHPLIDLLRTNSGMLVASEIPFRTEEEKDELLIGRLKEAKEMMRRNDAEILLLLGEYDTAHGLISLSKKAEDGTYTNEELQHIQNLGLEIGQLFENGFLYRQALRRVGVEM